MLKKWMPFFILALFSIVLVACSSEKEKKNDTKSADDAEGLTGELQFYTSQPDADAEALVKKFNEQHPDVKVNIFRSGTEEVIGKVLAENEAGEIQADVLLVADNITFEMLKEQDLLASYESPEMKAIPEQFVDPDFTYAGTKVMATIIAANTTNNEKYPSKWGDLAHPQAKGKTIMPSPLYSGAAAYNVGVFSRNDLGWEYFEKLKTNDLTVVQGNGAALKAVQSGEKDYGIVVDFIVARAKNEGSPIDLIYPEEGTPVITEPIGMLKNAKNEENAKAFIDFVLSEEGQKLAAEIGYTPIREGIAAPEGLKTIDQMKVLDADLEQLISGREKDKQQFKDLFGE